MCVSRSPQKLVMCTPTGTAKVQRSDMHEPQSKRRPDVRNICDMRWLYGFGEPHYEAEKGVFGGNGDAGNADNGTSYINFLCSVHK